MPRNVALLLLPLWLVVTSCTQQDVDRLPAADQQSPVNVSAPYVDPVDQYMTRATLLVTSATETTADVLSAVTKASEQARAPWSEDRTKSQIEAVRPPTSKPVLLDAMSSDEIIEALNTRAKPFIPEPLLKATTELISTIDEVVLELERISSELELLEYPQEAAPWRRAQLSYLDATREAYLYLGVTRARFLEMGAVPEIDSDRMSQAFDYQDLTLQMVELEFRQLQLQTGNNLD